MLDKVRPHSERLRAAIRESLAILSIHGDNWFAERLGISAEAEISALVGRLLTPLTDTRILSHADDLPSYAEAAPERFLGILDQDLRQDNPAVLRLLRPVEDALLGGCPRSGLLWALECLAWNPKWLAPVALILARLARTPINDNVANTPIASLKSIYRSWMPQTAANVSRREQGVEMLATRFSDIASEICLEQQNTRPVVVGEYSYRPRWRNDASGAGEPVSDRKEVFRFTRKVTTLVLEIARHDETILGRMVESLTSMTAKEQAVVWDLVENWAEESNDDVARAKLRDAIRRCVLTKHERGRDLGKDARERAHEICKRLEPDSVATRDFWLFESEWVGSYLDENDVTLANGGLDFAAKEARVAALRKASIKEIWTVQGFDGVRQLLLMGADASLVGCYASLCVPGVEGAITIVENCLAIQDQLHGSVDTFIRALLWQLEPADRIQVISRVTTDKDLEQIVRIHCLAPLTKEVWDLLEERGDSARDLYWKTVSPGLPPAGAADLMESIDRLLDIGRPYCAFRMARNKLSAIESGRLKRILLEMADSRPNPADGMPIDDYYAYCVKHALKILDRRPGMTAIEMAHLEFLFIEALDRLGGRHTQLAVRGR